ncbi:MAG: tetratricopeptide repeat protein [Akkermansiaceae bacterium]|jgi:tetratricopeptide (TPR) repeat protein|nr:tetratricopeptide repeat protein [Akkermansiaceae bacterium]MDP4647007.1 tetratricopeptide repeat protein [Akkermansiaceae bacterium]MDP4721294.1 tetratricopeptide repeat protein [Akkermansiaceae bacterium]MDP4778984.1 tetratricopeptide repeat protein [Akkermansiaceae bacterium]MDP4847186.1 tetratricopeptide repeat protein [Akkermansiaceae bacterium]
MKSLLILLLFSTLAFSQTATEWKKKGDALDAAGKTQQALEAYEKALEKSPKDPAILVKIAKQYGDMMPALNGAAKKTAGEKSLEFSRKAVEADQNHSDSHLAVALSLGKLTEFQGNKEKIKTSREIKERAEKALALNPKSDYAHHMLGRWHQEMAGIGGAARLLAKVVYGGIPNGTYWEALEHFRKARSINSRRLIHQIEYGRTLAMMDRGGEAKTEIQKGLNMPNRDADDEDAKARGRKTLEEI